MWLAPLINNLHQNHQGVNFCYFTFSPFVWLQPDVDLNIHVLISVGVLKFTLAVKVIQGKQGVAAATYSFAVVWSAVLHTIILISCHDLCQWHFLLAGPDATGPHSRNTLPVIFYDLTRTLGVIMCDISFSQSFKPIASTWVTFEYLILQCVYSFK